MIAAFYVLCACFGWSCSKAWWGFWAWRDRVEWAKLCAIVYGPLLLLIACSSAAPAPPVHMCDDCWAWCGKADSFKAALFCTEDCNEICANEGR